MKQIGGISWAVMALTAAAVVPGTAGAESPEYLCAPARVQQDGSNPAVLSMTDRFASRELILARPTSVCWSAGPGPTFLEGYGVRRRARKGRRLGVAIEVVTRFGRQSLEVKAFDEMRVPVTTAADAVPPGLACYTVRRAGNRAAARAVVTDPRAGEQVYDVGRAVRVCVPPAGATFPELVCHAVRLARTKPAQRAATAGTVTLTTWLGADVLRAGRARELCVPAFGVVDPGPEPEPSPPFALEVTPPAQEVIAGTKLALEATARFEDGHTEPYTSLIVWSSSDESVVRVGSSSTTGAFVEAVGLGSAVVSAIDPITGISSADTGGSTTVTVTWPLEKLVLSPHAITKQPGEHLGYTVTGWFTGGTTRNLTQRVVYASSRPAVATATNQPGNRSRVLAVTYGTTTISATDPVSGITTTDSGNDASLRVTGGLAYISVSSNLRHASRFPGQSQQFTAIGYFYGGDTLNLTQRCTWSSEDPAVAGASNPDGNRSRIDAIAPGFTFIRCTDPTSGQWGSTPFYVLGELENIQIYGNLAPRDWLLTGESLSLTALGQYAGGGFHNLTQDVVWASRDPQIAVATNDPGNRSRFVGLNGGLARAFATDPTTGMVSGDVFVTVLGDVVSLEILGTWNPTILPLEHLRVFSVRGVFEYGTLNLTYKGGYSLVSSDPSVLEIVDGRYVRGIAPGLVELTARDEASGVTSPPVTIRVQGALAAITLTPATATRGIGEWESFTAIGHYPPDITELLTQRLTYESSDPSVAVADNLPYARSRVRTVGAGTATITATDAATGVTGSATITVLPGTIERVTIEPATIVRNLENDFSFTGIGHYPDGSTINVTQVVTWQSLAPDVADATNEPGDRSRVVAKSAGEAVITALHPSGVSSHATGDDATFVAKPLVALTLSPESHLGPVGMVERYTLVGTFDDQTNINLTQDAYYWAEDPAIARADNLEGDRSAVELLTPGYTTVHASFAVWVSDYYPYPILSGSVAGAFLAVEP